MHSTTRNNACSSTRCVYAESGNLHLLQANNTQHGPYGENLALNFPSIPMAIDGWAAEEQHYNWGNPGFNEANGHWTQLVWQNTTQVGCGAVQCHNHASNGAHGLYLVCEYDPPGNIVGRFQTSVSKPGEKNGKLGIGAASRMNGCSALLVALVAASSLAAMWL